MNVRRISLIFMSHYQFQWKCILLVYYGILYKCLLFTFTCTNLFHITNACQSITTIKITEYSTEQFLHPANFNTIHHSAWPMNPTNSQLLSVNLSEILLQNLHLTLDDINSPLYFSDVEQSEPFVIRRRINDDQTKSFWYELTSIIPINRETICDVKRYPERVSISQLCCSATTTTRPTTLLLTDSVIRSGNIHSLNGPCCVFLGITVASSNTYFLRVDITDVNDNSPKFQDLIFGKSLINKQDNYGRFLISIMENTPPGRWIPLPKAIDLDEGVNAFIQYSIRLPNNEHLWSEYFKLIDNVQNSNIEANEIPTKVYLNGDTNEFSAMAADYNGPGLLILKTLDREVVSSFTFVLIANDMGQPYSRSSSLNIWLRILDENDNPPVFQKSEFHIEVNENKAGIPLLNIRVNDSDIDSNARLSYFLRPVSGINQVNPEYLRNHIQLLPSVEGVSLRISQPLDYEVQSQLTFEVVCVDQGQPALSASTLIKLTVLNMNDNPPIIKFYHHGQPLDSNYAQISVYENEFGNQSTENQILCHVHVTDLDDDLNNIQCSLEGNKNKQFELREVTTNRLVQKRKIFELITIISLDRESIPQHTLVIRCQDGTSESSLVGRNQLQIIVKDRNDNAPKFTQEHYRGHVKENAANTYVTLMNLNSEPMINTVRNAIHATDLDTGLNGQVTYSLEPLYISNQVASIQNYTDKHKEDSLLFGKSQAQQNAKTDAAKLIDNSTDDTEQYLKKRDPVHDTRKDVESFYIDPINGQLRTRVELDCEQQNVYYFTVVATDQAIPPDKRHTATALVTITVDDENDNPPVLEQRHYIFDISEGLPRHSLVGQIKSTDADRTKENRYITYEIRDVVNINASNLLFIEPNTGILRTRKILDREEIQQIPFIVIARNEKPKSKFPSSSSSPSLSPSDVNRTLFYDEASVTINIIDQNDNAPIMLHHSQTIPYTGVNDGGGLHRQAKQFQQPSIIDLKYNLNSKDPFNSCIEFPYYFIDADEKENAQIDVSLETNPYFEFRLDNTIICKISKEDPPLGQYTIHVIAQDRPLDSTKSLKRRYAIRMHIVNEQLQTVESQMNIPNNNIDSNALPLPSGGSSTHPAKWLQSLRSDVKDKKDLHFDNQYSKKISDSVNYYQPHQLSDIGDESSHRFGLSTMTIVAVLISVAGLLCLLLIGAVIAMKRLTPHSSNEVQVCMQKNNERERDRPGISVWNMTSYPSPDFNLNVDSGKFVEHHLGCSTNKYLGQNPANSFGNDLVNHPHHPSYPSTTTPTTHTTFDGTIQRFSPVSVGSLYGSVKYFAQPITIPATFKPSKQLKSPNEIALCNNSQSDLDNKRNSTLSKSCDELRMLTGSVNNNNMRSQNVTTPTYNDHITLNSDQIYTIKCQSVKPKYHEMNNNNRQSTVKISDEHITHSNGKPEQRIWLLSNINNSISNSNNNNNNHKSGFIVPSNDISDYQQLEQVKLPSMLRRQGPGEFSSKSGGNNDEKSNTDTIISMSNDNNNNNSINNNNSNNCSNNYHVIRQTTPYNQLTQKTVPGTLLPARSVKCLNLQKSFV
nr:unnamed protein product [Trichobilharzia regenti]